MYVDSRILYVFCIFLEIGFLIVQIYCGVIALILFAFGVVVARNYWKGDVPYEDLEKQDGSTKTAHENPVHFNSNNNHDLNVSVIET